jgi:hypothetical protein
VVHLGAGKTIHEAMILLGKAESRKAVCRYSAVRPGLGIWDCGNATAV